MSLDDLVAMLRRGQHSLVIAHGEVRSFDGRGIADLHRLFSEEPEFLYGASLADKIVGKGAAAVMVAGGVGEVFAEVISTPAIQMLTGAGIALRFAEEAPFIINRRGDGMCPVEALCRDCVTADECLPLITDFLYKIKEKH